ncbi:hypothetical protein [Myxococcus fulvus]|uniref:hypothetical protein n=1 Tax=Myxococcus fulvus TaxID=33 RepID=UPI0020C0AC33|nr:hypothetical protein [Myxococcus fulvus]MCK8502364.1 hypothetical protein [Myxococcus fulvus]
MRSLFGLVVALSLSACKEEPRGQLEPIPRPPGMKDAPAPGAAPTAAAQPPVDPSKVTLRWKLAASAPVTYHLDLERSGAAPAPQEAAEETPAKGKKGKGKQEPAPPRAAAPAASFPTGFTYVLERTNSGDYRLRVLPEGKDTTEDTGALSERGFVLDGLQGINRNLAALVLELPLAPVGPNDTWALGTELLTHDALGPLFTTTKTERRNRVKLTALTQDGDDQVATLEYDLLEQLSGKVTSRRAPPAVPARADDPAEEDAEPTTDESAGPPTTDASAEVRITGKGEFLVKAGRWRTWAGTIASSSRGPFPTNALQVPPGTVKLTLTARESAPPAATAKPQQ